MQKPLGPKIFLAVVILTISTAVIYGIILLGSPSEQRAIQFDQRRESDLQQISFAIDAYWARNEVLPEILEDLQDTRHFIRSVVDPVTGEQYEYQILSDITYELCAVFENDSAKLRGEFEKPFSERIWDHDAGRACFELEVRKSSDPFLERGPVPIPVPAR